MKLFPTLRPVAYIKNVYGRLNVWIARLLSKPKHINWPKIHRPKIHIPKISLPRVHLPKVKMPTLVMPQLPKLTIPTIRLPRIPIPKVKWPQFRVPKFNFKYVLNFRHVVTSVLVFMCLYVLVAMNDDVIASGVPKFDFAHNNNFTLVTFKKLPDDLNNITPAAGTDFDTSNALTSSESYDDDGRYPIERNTLDVEAVLIPRDTTVISSSRDSKLKAIYFDNGETFKKGDVLVEYICKDARAEVEIAEIQQDLTQKKSATGYKLFKLDIISDLEKYEFETENKQAAERAKLYQSRMDECFIRAEYDGRVVKRLANAGEFTRTDRVLMEVASLDYLKAEFLLPSRWLRWVNVDANIDIKINETDKTYAAVIKYIYGEVDPISQSVQVTAQLQSYEDPLLPGMSGSAHININAIRADGIYGFLEQKQQNSGQ